MPLLKIARQEARYYGVSHQIEVDDTVNDLAGSLLEESVAAADLLEHFAQVIDLSELHPAYRPLPTPGDEVAQAPVADPSDLRRCMLVHTVAYKARSALFNFTRPHERPHDAKLKVVQARHAAQVILADIVGDHVYESDYNVYAHLLGVDVAASAVVINGFKLGFGQRNRLSLNPHESVWSFLSEDMVLQAMRRARFDAHKATPEDDAYKGTDINVSYRHPNWDCPEKTGIYPFQVKTTEKDAPIVAFNPRKKIPEINVGRPPEVNSLHLGQKPTTELRKILNQYLKSHPSPPRLPRRKKH